MGDNTIYRYSEAHTMRQCGGRMNDLKEYLGDSVYVNLNDCGQLVLTTGNGYPDDPRNTIYLEPEVLKALMAYLERIGYSERVTSNNR